MLERLRRGQRLGRYELLAPVGEGGMASVWLARSHGSRGFEKLVALKTIKASLADDALFERWFLDEARIAQRIFHSNVAATLDLGEEDGALFLVMEWIDGDSLARVRRTYQRATGNPLPVPIALRIVADMCKGLHAAHELVDERGALLHVVHRDVSPNNVLVTGSGAVKIIDFGIATARDRTSPETALGLVRGKANYLAPEQIHRRAPLDRRCDVWGAGVCLYELLVGTLPFAGNDSDEALRRILSASAPPSFDGDPEIDEILCRSLAPYPEDRFATAAEMQQAIEALLTKDGASATEDGVAEFLANELPRLAETRRAWIEDALHAPAVRPATSGAISGAMNAGGDASERPARRARRWIAAFALAAVGVAGGLGAAFVARRPHTPPPLPAAVDPDRPASDEAPSSEPRTAPTAASPSMSPPQPPQPSADASASPRVANKKPASVGAMKKPRIASPANAVSSPPPKERDVGF